MGTTMKATMKVEVAGAGTSSATYSLTAEAYDQIEVTATAGSSVEVQVQPGGSGQVQLLFLTADAYSSDLKYSVDGGATDVVLDAPQLLLGTGAVSLLDAAPKKITFANGTASDVDVRILVGRAATPPPP